MKPKWTDNEIEGEKPKGLRPLVKQDVGVIVGRFQVPELHSAHKALIQGVLDMHARVIIVLGMSAVVGTRTNPLDYLARRQMIHEEYPEVDVLYVKDCKSNGTWSAALDKVVRDLIGPTQTAILYGSRDSFIKAYTGAFTTVELESSERISGSAIREAMAKKAQPSYDFRAGAIWQAHNRYPTSYATVDIAVTTINGRVLLGRKEGEAEYRFPGGFADPRSESFEADAYRELLEETGVRAEDLDGMRYLTSHKVNDWRYRGDVDCIKTMLFVARALPGREPTPAAGDDLAEVCWKRLVDVVESIMVPEHRVLLNDLKTHIGIGVK